MSDTQSQGLAIRQPVATLAVSSRFRFIPTSMGEAREMAMIISQSGMTPDAYRSKPNDILIAYEYGSALGLSWLQALRSISVINGQASLWGDAVPALIYGSGECERFHEVWVGKEFEDGFKAVCTMKRKGMPDEVVREFSVADAKIAKLWMKVGRAGGDTPWVTYPKRMLQMRARGFAARDTFPDKLAGLILAEEAMDYPDAIDTPVIASVAMPASDVVFQRLPEGLRDAIEKGFATLQMAPAQRLQKLNEFLLAEDGTDEEKGENLLRWARDEFAKRKTGQPVASKKPTNGIKPPVIDVKPAETKAADPTLAPKAAVESSTPPIAASDIPWGGESASQTLGF